MLVYQFTNPLDAIQSASRKNYGDLIDAACRDFIKVLQENLDEIVKTIWEVFFENYQAALRHGASGENYPRLRGWK